MVLDGDTALFHNLMGLFEVYVDVRSVFELLLALCTVDRLL